jgi:hypothetical protein
LYVEKKLPNQPLPTPFTNCAGYRLLSKLCLHKSKIAEAEYDKAMLLLDHVKVGDQRLHDVLDANASSSSGEARAFVMGAQEAEAQEVRAPRGSRPARTAPLDLDAFERQCLEDDGLDQATVALRLAKAAMARQYRDGSAQHLAVVKRQKIADVEKYEAESKAAKEKCEAESSAVVEKMKAERDQTQVERARIQAERQQVEDDAKSAREERERQRVHAAELAEEKRRAEIRKAAAEIPYGETNLMRDPGFAGRLALAEIELKALEMTEMRTLWEVAAGDAPGAQSSLLKLKGTEIVQRVTEFFVEIAGDYAIPWLPEIIRPGNEVQAVGPNWAQVETLRYFEARSASIAGGTDEVQRNIISKHVLKL